MGRHGTIRRKSGRRERPHRVRLGRDLVVDYPTPSSASASVTMRRNRGRDTAPELAVRRALFAAGHRYRVHRRIQLAELSVRPDIVFVRARVAVFIDGCFWHGCPAHGTQPKANAGYWGPKLERNQRRDRRNTAALISAGCQVVRGCRT